MGKRILLVEDEPMIRDLYLRTLRSGGYDVTSVEDGEEGYKAILTGNYDLVLLDIMLPEIDGVEILRKLREEDDGKTVTSKIVMLTNLDFESVQGKADAYHADGYLIKDQVDILHLVDEVAKYLGE